MFFPCLLWLSTESGCLADEALRTSAAVLAVAPGGMRIAQDCLQSQSRAVTPTQHTKAVLPS